MSKAGQKASGMSDAEMAALIKLLMKESPESLGFAKGGLTSVKDQILRDRKPTSKFMEAIRRKLAGKGKLTITEKADIIMGNSSSGKGGRGKARRPAGFGMSSSTRKSGTGKARKPAGFGVSSNTRKNITTGGKPKTKEPRRMADPMSRGTPAANNRKKDKSGMIPDTVPQERRTTPEGKMGSAAKRGPSSTRKKNTATARKPRMTEAGTRPSSKAQSGISPVPKRGNPPPSRPKGTQPKDRQA